MTWWGWLILLTYVAIGWIVMFKISGKILEECGSPNDFEEYAFSTLGGLLAGITWGIIASFILLGAVLNPHLGKALVKKLDLHLPERTKKDKTDEEVRKEVERLRREYAMPRWKRAVLRLIRV